MPYISRNSLWRIAAYLAALLLIALAYYFHPWLIPFPFPVSEACSLLLLAWAVSVYRRILQHRVRPCFLLGAGLLILTFLLRLWRYNLDSDVSPLSRYLWYAYYVPMTAVPLAALAAALRIGRAEDAETPRCLRLLRLLWLLLAACIMANDLHGWMFRITETVGDTFQYSHGPLYYLSFGWIALVSLASFAVLMRRCRLSQCRRLWFVPALDIRAFQKKHRKEYEAMVKRTPSVGSMKDNMFAAVMYLACYGFSYYKADPGQITTDVFDGMIDAICKSDMMKRFYRGKNCFDPKEIEKYVRGAERSGKREYPMDWVFDFSYDLSVPEYYVTHRECGVCKIGQREHLEFLTPHMCVMDYPTIEYKGGKLLRTKTLGAGGDCCDFHVVKGEPMR